MLAENDELAGARRLRRERPGDSHAPSLDEFWDFVDGAGVRDSDLCRVGPRS